MRLPDLRTDMEIPAACRIESATVAVCEQPAPPRQEETTVAMAASPTVAAETEAASKQISSPEEKKISPPPSDSVTPAAQRRQRALERQRRLETETAPRSWWTSHAPMIAGGFLVALVVTVVMARNNREQPTPIEQARMDPPTPELNIEMGGPSIEAPSLPGTSLTAPPALIGATEKVAEETLPPQPAPKLPELLSASPPADAAGNATTASAEAELPSQPRERVAAKAPVNPTLESAYPSTDPTSYRASGLAPNTPTPSETEPIYPSTSAPNSWR
jgi:hypothetical protein